MQKKLENIVFYFFYSPKKKTDTKPEEDSIKKEYCEWCVEGFDTDKYYEHTCLEHFRKLFEEHIIPENAKDMRYVLYIVYRKVASSRPVYYSIFDHFWGATNQDVLLTEMCYYCHL